MNPVQAGLRLAFAHHPLCGTFRHDVVRVAGLHLCAGCAILLPSFLLSSLVAVLLLHAGVAAVPLAAAASLLALPQAVTYLRRWPRAMRVAAKLVGGLGLGLFLVAAFAALALPSFLLLMAIIGVAAVVGQGVRMHAIWQTCKACPYRADWETCPGFVPRTPFEWPLPPPGR